MSLPPEQLPLLIELLDRIEHRVGLNFPDHKHESSWTIIQQAMKAEGITELAAYSEFLETSDRAFEDLAGKLTVGETFFFRDTEQFELIHQEILPYLYQQHPAEPIRIWSAACSSGEEPYSLAMMVEEMGFGEHAEIFASDISREALDRAKTGQYRPWSLRGEYRDWTDRYLEFDGTHYSIDPQIKQRVRFGYFNLVEEETPQSKQNSAQWDLILCRNVLIYFDLPTIRRVAMRLYRALKPGGWLLLGAADPPIWDAAPFQTTTSTNGVIYRRLPEIQAPQALRDVVIPTLPPLPDRWEDRTPPARLAIKLPARPKSSAVFSDVMHQTEQALKSGDYRRAVSMISEFSQFPAACGLQIRALANIEPHAALDACARFSELHPTSAELHYLHAVLLMDLNEVDQAIIAARRALYLDRSLVIVHYTLGTLLHRQGNRTSASKSLKNARQLSEQQPLEETVPLADGETFGRVLESIQFQLDQIEAEP